MAIVEVNYARDAQTGQVQFNAQGYPLILADPTANTYGQLQQRVQYEVLGSPTLADVQQAIQDAIAEYQAESFWFNDVRYFGGNSGSLSDFQTVAGKEFYSYQDLPMLVSMPHIRTLSVFAFDNRYPLEERTQQWMDDVSISPTWQGLPTDWCQIAGAIRLYPIPDNVYELIPTGTIRFQPMVNPSDFSVWSNRAEALIRMEAKRLLFTNITRDAQQAALMEREVMGDPSTGRQGALAMLRRETMRRAGGPGRLRASRGYF